MGRIDEPQDPLFAAINTSLSFDKRLWPHDIALSRAHCKMLAKQKIIDAKDRDAILKGLGKVENELASGKFPFEETDEDIHMAIERRLTELEPAGAKIHTARSRNDQVATDVALFTRTAANAAIDEITYLQEELLATAESHVDWRLPGYTHLQRAQPIYVSHHLLAYFWMLQRDRTRFEAVHAAAGVMPLGSGALAGVNFETDREFVAKELGFDSVSPNSVDAVSNRDFVFDYLAAATTCATHLSRLGQEIVLWTSTEFGFFELSDSWSSGSSLMPQKKNPDAAELLRAKAPRISAHFAALQGVMHGLPLTYNKDLQEDKEHLFDAADTLLESLRAAKGMLATGQFNRPAMEAAASDEVIAATDLADMLVKQGTPFREAHGKVGSVVRIAEETRRPLKDVAVEELGPDAAAVLAESSWLESKVSQGGTALPRVKEQLKLAHKALK
jgi:argininosuccinate lyase